MNIHVVQGLEIVVNYRQNQEEIFRCLPVMSTVTNMCTVLEPIHIHT